MKRYIWMKRIIRLAMVVVMLSLNTFSGGIFAADASKTVIQASSDGSMYNKKIIVGEQHAIILYLQSANQYLNNNSLRMRFSDESSISTISSKMISIESAEEYERKAGVAPYYEYYYEWTVTIMPQKAGEYYFYIEDLDGYNGFPDTKIYFTVSETENCQHKNAIVKNQYPETCTEEGYSGDTYCQDCGSIILNGIYLSPLGHSFGTWIVTEPATVFSLGTETRTCTRCGYKETRVTAAWNSNPYNLRDETYSFENSFKNFGNSCRCGGHCFGMTITSAGYYNRFLDIGNIGGDEQSSLYSFTLSKSVKDQICYYQKRQGDCRNKAIVAGGSFHLFEQYNLGYDWEQVVNYVKTHIYDGTGLLQVGIRGFRNDNNGGHEGGHALSFLRYENVDEQDRIYCYDSNSPNQESYFYKDSSGRVLQAPNKTYDEIRGIDVRDIRSYFKNVGNFDITNVLYMIKNDVYILGHSFTYMDSLSSEGEYVMYEIPSDQDCVTIVPLKDNATFVYMDKEYSFGQITDKTYATLKLASGDEATTSIDAGFEIHNEPKKKDNKDKISIKAPSSIKTKVKKNKVIVSWKKLKKNDLKKVKNIQVQYATNKKFTKNLVTKKVRKEKTKYTLSIKKKGTYYIRVRYVGKDGASKWSKTKKVKVK